MTANEGKGRYVTIRINFEGYVVSGPEDRTWGSGERFKKASKKLIDAVTKKLRRKRDY